MTKRNFCFCLLMISLVLTSCAGTTKTLALDETLLEYARYIRWSQYESALGLHHPQYLADHPVTALDLQRLNLFKVTGYSASERNMLGDGSIVEQRVIIRMYNNANVREISIVHNQVWKYDAEFERWLLHSGLPDVTSRR